MERIKNRKVKPKPVYPLIWEVDRHEQHFPEPEFVRKHVFQSKRRKFEGSKGSSRNSLFTGPKGNSNQVKLKKIQFDFNYKRKPTPKSFVKSKVFSTSSDLFKKLYNRGDLPVCISNFCFYFLFYSTWG